MPDVSNDWNKVRYELDKSANFQALCNSPWYTDAVYEKFSDAEYARRHALARKMVSIRDVRGGQHGHYGRAVAERLAELGLQQGRIGITAADRTGPEFMGVNAYLELQKHLPQATLVFLPLMLHELTYRKSPEEIRAMARAGELAIKAQLAVAATARPGLREYQLAAAATHAVLDGGGQVHLLMLGSTSMQDPRLILITSLPFISLDEVKVQPYDMVMQPGMAYGIEITPVSADGTFGIFFSRSFAITDGGVQALTPYPVDEIIVAGH